MIDLYTKIEVLSEFLDCANITLWHFDGEMRLLSSTASNQELFAMLLAVGGNRENILEYCRQNKLPGFASDSASLLWLAAPKYAEETLTDIYLIGPVFSSTISEGTLAKALHSLHIAPELCISTLKLLKSVPIIQHTFLIQYGIMLHRCLTGEKLITADIHIIHAADEKERDIPQNSDYTLSSPVFAMEQQLFQAVEDGNIDYVHPKEVYQLKTGMLSKGNPLRHAKNECVSCLTLLTRAAIRGGMPEKSAYALSDYYIQLAEDSNQVTAVYQCIQDAFRDYTERVHKYKLGQGRSKEIQECISYLELHLAQKVTMTDLAGHLGYNKNYLSTKFCREVGMSVNQYLLKLRLERAKLLLRNTDESIQEISDALGFGSVSYFSSRFKDETGQTPTDYRNYS